MDFKLSEIRKFCKENNYEVLYDDGYKMEINTGRDMWLVKCAGKNQYTLSHLNKLGKMKWHKQGNRANYTASYVMHCMKTHNKFIK